MSHGNRVPGIGTRYDKWTPNRIAVERRYTRGGPLPLRRRCHLCGESKPLYGGSVSVERKTFFCKSCVEKRISQ